MMKTYRLVPVAALVVACLLSLAQGDVLGDDEAPVHSALQKAAGSVICITDPEMDELLLVDISAGKILYYKVEPQAGLTLKDVQDYRADLVSTVQKPAPPLLTLVERDVPGEDPPGMARLEGGVRTMAGHDRSPEREFWQAEYRFRARPEVVFELLGKQLEGWTVTSSCFGCGGSKRAYLRVKQGELDLDAVIEPFRGQRGEAGCTLRLDVTKTLE